MPILVPCYDQFLSKMADTSGERIGPYQYEACNILLELFLNKNVFVLFKIKTCDFFSGA